MLKLIDKKSTNKMIPADAFLIQKTIPKYSYLKASGIDMIVSLKLFVCDTAADRFCTTS